MYTLLRRREEGVEKNKSKMQESYVRNEEVGTEEHSKTTHPFRNQSPVNPSKINMQ
jgi:hypothetical protein